MAYEISTLESENENLGRDRRDVGIEIGAVYNCSLLLPY